MSLYMFTGSIKEVGFMNKNFQEIITVLLTETLKKYIPIFWIPILGNYLIEKIKRSRAVELMYSGWVMLSLM